MSCVISQSLDYANFEYFFHKFHILIIKYLEVNIKGTSTNVHENLYLVHMSTPHNSQPLTKKWGYWVSDVVERQYKDCNTVIKWTIF